MPEPVSGKAQMLVEETRQNIETQKVIVAELEQRGIDATSARKLLAMWEEALVRRIEILNQIRSRARRKR
jgi:hypothetical protein